MTKAAPPEPEGVRLQKYLSSAGVTSRREAESLIREGRITVNGRAARLGQRVDPARDEVRIDGAPIAADRSRVYLAFCKPSGVVTTTRDPEGRPTVMDFIGVSERVYPVGRLDAATEGLLILTNDGDLAHRLMHPSFELAKTYVAEVAGRVGLREIRLLQKGVRIDRGQPVRVSGARVVASSRRGSVVEIQVHEGRKHVVRRVFEHIGHPVQRLVRTAIGDVRLGRMQPGTYRNLTKAEIRRLYERADG